MYGEEEGQYHPESVYYTGNENGNENGNGNAIDKDEVIRECASILREFSELEWEELERRLPNILPEIEENEDQLGIFPRDELIPYLKKAVAKDNHDSPKLQVTHKLYNQHTITAISDYLNDYAMSFDKNVFLELLDDIQDPANNVVPVNVPNIPYGTSNSQAEYNKKYNPTKRRNMNIQAQQNMRNIFGNVGSLPTTKGGRKRKTSKQSKARRRRSRTARGSKHLRTTQKRK